LPDNATATQMFRIAQEAVTNALRHGNPRQVRVTLFADPKDLRLRIRDDGVGFSGNLDHRNGLGLRIMEYRAGLIGGDLRVGPVAGGGTVVTLTLPWRNPNEK
jgi:two-component system sensor kinase FixL